MPTEVKHRWISTDGDMDNPDSWSDGTVPATVATGVLTFTALPAINDTVKIEEVPSVVRTYRFVDALSATDDVLRGGTLTTARDNLVAAVMVGGADPNVENSTTVHPDVTAVATSTDQLSVTAKLKGTTANVIATTVPIGAYGSWVNATLTGGTTWDVMDEIVVDEKATQDFTTNLDWSLVTSDPVVSLKRINVARNNIKIGASGNPLKISLVNSGALNYLSTGVMHAEFGECKSIYVDSITSERVLFVKVLGDGLQFLYVESGEVEVVAGSLIDNVSGASYCAIGELVVLRLRGIDEPGPLLLAAVEGEIVNERKVVGPQWVVVAPGGRLIQRGVLEASFGFGILNLGGVFSYEPTASQVNALFVGLFIKGLSRFDLSEFDVKARNLITAREARLLRGPLSMTGLAGVDVDFDDEFPF